MRHRGRAIAPVLALLLFALLLVTVRYKTPTIPTDVGFYVLAILPIASLAMARRLLRLLPVLSFGAFFLVLIHGLGKSQEGVFFSMDSLPTEYLLFLLLLFVYVTALTGYFHPGSWHQGLTAIGVPSRSQILLFGGVGALRIITNHVSETALLAKLQHGRFANPIRRFLVLVRAAVPLFYGSLVKLEAGLISLEQRKVYHHSGVMLPYSKQFYVRAWLSNGLAAAGLAFLWLGQW